MLKCETEPSLADTSTKKSNSSFQRKSSLRVSQCGKSTNSGVIDSFIFSSIARVAFSVCLSQCITTGTVNSDASFAILRSQNLKPFSNCAKGGTQITIRLCKLSG